MTQIIAALFALPLAFFTAQQNPPIQEAGAPACYQAGDTIAPEVFVQDASGAKIRLLDLATPDTKVIYLLLFGGPTLVPESGQGGYWCRDSFNDMPVSYFLYLKYRDRGVTFVPVACPPVYHEQEYGFAGDTFLALPDTSSQWQQEFQAFVAAAYELQQNRTIPFDQLYFDPKFRLMFNHRELTDESQFSDPILPWMGKFKPCTDQQSYSVPAIWLLSPTGKVLHEPFAGNRYSSSTPHLNYTVREVEAALQQALATED